jgi:hypothetical protein
LLLALLLLLLLVFVLVVAAVATGAEEDILRSLSFVATEEGCEVDDNADNDDDAGSETFAPVGSTPTVIISPS